MNEFVASVSVVAYGGLDKKRFDYSVPLDCNVIIGSIVKVPFGKKESLGIVYELTKSDALAGQKKPLLPIIAVLIDTPLPQSLMSLADWMIDYYAASPRAVWRTILPSGLTQKSRLKTTAPPSTDKNTLPLQLNAEQRAVVQQFRDSELRGSLLHGITGSGKTEVYIELVAEQLSLGQSVILLVPEIALTPQMVERLTAHFADSIVVNHSKLTPAKRKSNWLTVLQNDRPYLVIGPRSSLFLPVVNLGLVIVDEEHESSYKQENAPTYQANQVTAKLCEIAHARYMLGSATPSLSSYWLAQHGKIQYLQLTKRALQAELPPVEIVNLQDQPQLLSPRLVNSIKHSLANHKQVLLFLNRRGSASALICHHCGEIVRCPRCDMSLVFHGDLARLLCHYCNYSQLPPNVCPSCHKHDLAFIGSGTKKVESQIHELFPHHRIGRLDSDNADLEHVEEIFHQLRDGELDIVIGTQMIARGLDLPNVTLVGVISTESMLAIPDFSSSERTFQLLTQVAGRAGRSIHSGAVIMQTLSPNHPAIVAAAKHDYQKFYHNEIALRGAHAYPPFVYLVKLIYGHRDATKAESTARTVADMIQDEFGRSSVVLGPTPRMVKKIAGKYQWQIIVKSKRRSTLLAIVRSLKPDWKYDLDPINLT